MKRINKLRNINGDLKFNSINISKFINFVMKDGKKDKARKIVYKTIEELGENGLEFFEELINKYKFQFSIKRKKLGGATYIIPTKLSLQKSISKLLKTIIKNARKRRIKNPFFKSLALELKETFEKKSQTFKEKENLSKIIEANKAFSYL